MNGRTLYSIGELARRTGSTVKTIRFYSDSGLLPPADRSPAGYRLYDHDAVTRLDLVRTLRDLGLDLVAIRKVMDRELALPEVAAVHADALDVQIRILRLRRAVLTAVASRGATPEETHLMHKLAKLSEVERRQLVGDFLDAAFGGVGTSSMVAGIMRSMTPELPENPDTKQVQAWVELAELSQDPDFRALVRDLAQERTARYVPGRPPALHNDVAAIVRDQVTPAVAAGVEPASPQADPVVAVLMTRCAHLLDCGDDATSRGQLLVRLERMNDPRRERYSSLLAVINGWPGPESLRPVLDWAVHALRARTRG
ncbi:MerR family transcriptional regulator [Streptomyces capillispiralis]|uniref:DNA-binding transcriptional MerR regulator n=1 Tax=Streptomyces capillispiralis TaxID=68182 RepID=A0A561T8J4_9ACTN|nr:MerR family transcriptional regulator [Streptomyces capillispiralis]TWF83431.1 DNA-binding transcriptional MerR regulator [Streptomyces capillispiralis]GHH91781.1 MerR family transcriptional regulator [Streptomyces capillispiralis]